MLSSPVRASFTDFELPATVETRDATVAIPVSNGVQQRYFFINMKTRKGLRVCYPRRPGITTKEAVQYLTHLCTFAMNPNHYLFPRSRVPFRRFHNGISFFEVLFKVLKPHGMTYIGNQRFLVSLWSASIYFVIDLRQRTIEMQMEDKDRREVFSTYQYFDDQSNQTYYATQMGSDEFYKHDKEAIHFDLPIKIKTYNWDTGKISEIWHGDFDTDAHYLQLNKNRRYLALAQFGDFYDEQHKLLPSKLLILDLKTKKDWRVDNTGWSPSAHIDWDPVDPNTVYFSCHNGAIGPVASRLEFLKKKAYHWNIYGPASVHKYEMTKTGPKKVGIFTHKDMFRQTIHKVFMHRGKKILAASGFPNHLFFADADKMKFTKRVKILDPCGNDTVMGSFFPSPDGEKIFLVTTGTFQILDFASGKVDLVHDLGTINDPFNHMTSVADADW
jgi:hypothetical protein